MTKRRSLLLFLAASFLSTTPIISLRGSVRSESKGVKFVTVRLSKKTTLLKKSVTPNFYSLQCSPLDTVFFEHREKRGDTTFLLKTETLVIPAAPTHPIFYTDEKHGFNLALYPKGQPCKTQSMKLI